VNGSCKHVKASDLQSRNRESGLDETQLVFDIIFSVSQMQWDPGTTTVTAWGQVMFRGAGNVMT
jgi:hypothetical protein